VTSGGQRVVSRATTENAIALDGITAGAAEDSSMGAPGVDGIVARASVYRTFSLDLVSAVPAEYVPAEAGVGAQAVGAVAEVDAKSVNSEQGTLYLGQGVHSRRWEGNAPRSRGDNAYLTVFT
jgi:hypothetical protein